MHGVRTGVPGLRYAHTMYSGTLYFTLVQIVFNRFAGFNKSNQLSKHFCQKIVTESMFLTTNRPMYMTLQYKINIIKFHVHIVTNWRTHSHDIFVRLRTHSHRYISIAYISQTTVYNLLPLVYNV